MSFGMRVEAVRRRQRGITLIGLLAAAIVVGALALVVVQVVPTYVEYLAIQRAATKAAQEGGTVQQIRLAFQRQKDIDAFTAVAPADLDITKVNEQIVISFAYDKEIHLVGPAYLLIRYEGRSR